MTRSAPLAPGIVVAFWNRNKNADPKVQAAWLAEPCEAGCPRWDVLVLAEATRRATDRFVELGSTSVSWTELHPELDGRAHGIHILVRHPFGARRFDVVAPPTPPAELAPDLVAHVRERGDDWHHPRPLRTERWAAVDVLHANGEPAVRVAGFHAPYAAGERVWDTLQNRLTKRTAYQQLTEWARTQAATGTRLVVALDGNNWSDRDADGRRHPPSPQRRFRSRPRRLLEEAKLFDAENDFHGPTPSHGLFDTYRQAVVAGTVLDPHGSRTAAELLPSRPVALTYRLKHDGHRMDRIYASADVEVQEAGVCHGPLMEPELVAATRTTKLAPGSDHALVWTRLRV